MQDESNTVSFFVPEHAEFLLRIRLGEPVLRLRIREAEVAREAVDVARADLDLEVRAAVCGALGAGVLHTDGHGEGFFHGRGEGTCPEF
jgi:hypothetical protein